MKWITRSHVHVDRVACPWLITRFIDNEAEFLFVPVSQLDKVVQETGAIPFDAPGVELGHGEDGRCSFESIILNTGSKSRDFYDWRRLSMRRMSVRILIRIPSHEGWKRLPAATVCVSLRTWKIWSTSLRSMTHSTRGAGLKLQEQNHRQSIDFLPNSREV